MEISVYGIHHIVGKYLSLRQYVYLVSDWMVFLCSFLCCQCTEYADRDMPLETLSDSSFIPYQITPRKVEVDTERACGDPCNWQQLVIDFHHFDEDDKLKCTEILGRDSRRDLVGMEAIPDNHLESPPTELTHNSAPTKESPVASKRNDDYPTVHNHKKIQETQPVCVEITT